MKETFPTTYHSFGCGLDNKRIIKTVEPSRIKMYKHDIWKRNLRGEDFDSLKAEFIKQYGKPELVGQTVQGVKILSCLVHFEFEGVEGMGVVAYPSTIIYYGGGDQYLFQKIDWEKQ